jgi:cell division protein FtsW
MRDQLRHLKGDSVMWMIVILLMSFSLLTVYSFVPILVRIEGGTPFYYLVKHLTYVVLGFMSMFAVHRINTKYFSQISQFVYYLAIALLVFTIFFGIKVNGAERWIRVFGLTFQSSDFAKLALIMYLSKLLVKKEKYFDDWKLGVLHVMAPIFIICLLILKDNLSTALMLFTISFALLFIARFPWKKLLLIMISIMVGILLFISVQEAFPTLQLSRYQTWKARIVRLWEQKQDPSASKVENAQANNAKLAIFNGALIGQGVGDGQLKSYIPEAYADFYFASFIEEFGLISGVLLALTYIVLLFRIIKIAFKTEVLFETYLCLGIGIHLLMQASINMLVCIGFVPVTGQNMPFLAMGGSALIMACVSIGIVQSVARANNKLTATATSFDYNGDEKTDK